MAVNEETLNRLGIEQIAIRKTRAAWSIIAYSPELGHLDTYEPTLKEALDGLFEMAQKLKQGKNG